MGRWMMTAALLQEPGKSNWAETLKPEEILMLKPLAVILLWKRELSLPNRILLYRLAEKEISI